MSLVWLFSKQIPLALLPFTVYSIFHVATYTRTFLIPAILSSPQSPGAAPGGKSSSKNSPLGENIGKFVKEYYEPSMSLVALLEVALWFRLFGSALIFQKGSWVLLLIYSIFFRARFSQSNFVQEVVKMASSRIDVQVASQSTPPLARQAWAAFKNGLRQLHDVTDARKYFPGPTVNGAGQKKGQ
ncbi:MAG: hypothetical protein M1829_005498 [Trizodia sp. TS-e1964]|nr:MAG: hypothetical protein M1829_005498 [Trizodia sp. TS-e1964]